jgi:hypothetical protein
MTRDAWRRTGVVADDEDAAAAFERVRGELWPVVRERIQAATVGYEAMLRLVAQVNA